MALGWQKGNKRRVGFLVSKREENSVEGHKKREWKPFWYLFWFGHPRTIFICLSLLCLIHSSVSKFVHDVTMFFFFINENMFSWVWCFLFLFWEFNLCNIISVCMCWNTCVVLSRGYAWFGMILVVAWLVCVHVHAPCNLHDWYYVNTCFSLEGFDQPPYVGILR